MLIRRLKVRISEKTNTQKYFFIVSFHNAEITMTKKLSQTLHAINLKVKLGKMNEIRMQYRKKGVTPS